MEELKPCPFCGGDNVKMFYDESQNYYVECYDCNKTTSFHIAEESSWAKAVEIYNRRTTPETKTHRCVHYCTDGACNAGECHFMTDTGGCEISGVLKTAPENKPLTNGDRIRNMADNELAKIIASSDIAEKIPFCKNLPECDSLLENDTLIPEELCQKCVIAWLEQEDTP